MDSRFKFCAFVASPVPREDPARCAFFRQDVSEIVDPERCFPLSAADECARVNPNTGTAPIFRSRRDAELTTAIYDRLPVLVDRSSGEAVKAWPVKYSTMFHMTNDSDLFRTRSELEEKEGAWSIPGNRFDSPSGEWLPLYEGRMVQAFDHRAASIVINPKILHRPAQPKPATLEQHRDPRWLPDPQFWVRAPECGWSPESSWVVGFKEVSAPTNVRTFIAALLPAVGFGDKGADLEARIRGSQGMASRRKSQRDGVRFRYASEGPGSDAQPLYSGATSRRPAGAVRGRELWTQDGGGDRPRGVAGTHIHGARHGTVCPPLSGRTPIEMIGANKMWSVR